jgi:RNA polymerase subunit RPABC4/transcription elongation factor Spt4
MAEMTHTCPACGYPGLTEEPHSPTTSAGSYEICPSCGFEFGVTDDDEGFSYEEWRQRWVHRGMPWDSAGIESPPDGWDPLKQLQGLKKT